MRLNPVLDDSPGYFDPFFVVGPSEIGVIPTFEVPSGGFSHAEKVFWAFACHAFGPN